MHSSAAAYLRDVDAVGCVPAARLLLVAVLEAPPALLVPQHHTARAAAHVHAPFAGPHLQQQWQQQRFVIW
jgi:hypothetical protein